MPDDWRLERLRVQPFLRGVRLKRRPYKTPRPEWDHDHCAACWAKFSERQTDLREGFATCADYERGENDEWVCPDCFALFKDEMGWIEAN
jgi:hypothetical protein